MMDACLHGLHNVLQAKAILEELRVTEQGKQLLESRHMYIQHVHQCIHHAHVAPQDRAPGKLGRGGVAALRHYGVRVCLYPLRIRTLSSFRRGSALVPRVRTRSRCRVPSSKDHDPVALLLNIVQHEIAPTLVISDRAFTSSEEATEAIRTLSKA